MREKPLLNLLKAYNPSEEEQVYKQRMIQFIQAEPRCFERSLSVGHITASAWLLSRDHQQVLLMHHKKLTIWVQPGGHCDGNKDVLAVALKEAQEESGIQGIEAVDPGIFDIDIHLIPATTQEPEHYHYDVRFLLQVKSNEQVQQNHESHELRWIDKNIKNLPTQERSVLRMVEKWCKRT